MPALILVLVAPIIGEFLLGNIPLDAGAAVVYPVLAMLYGAGAVLIRETARRTGRGYPTIFGLALAYGVLEEGVVTQSLFNPGFAGLELQGYGEVGLLGITAPWTVYVLTIHSVWSIVVPIAIVEALVPHRRHRSWVNVPALAGIVLLYLVGFAALFVGTLVSERFLASPGQLLGAAAVAAVVVAVSLRFRPVERTGGPVARPVVVAIGALGAGSAVIGLFTLGATERLLPAWPTVAATLAVIVVGAGALGRQGERAAWTDRHHLAAVTGAVLTYCWAGFLVQGSEYGLRPANAAVQAVVVVGVLALLVVARRRSGTGDEVATAPVPVPPR